jgi:hypothetical protein
LKNSNWDESTPNTDSNSKDCRYDDHHLRIDIYHHFDKGTEDLISKFTNFISNPIVIELTNSSGIPTQITLIPGVPRQNNS